MRRAAWQQIGTPKSGKSRVVGLNKAALAVSKALPRSLHDPFLFKNGEGKLYQKSDGSLMIQRAAKPAGIKRIESVGWHTMRHTFTSHLIMAGENFKVVQELPGHATLERT